MTRPSTRICSLYGVIIFNKLPAMTLEAIPLLRHLKPVEVQALKAIAQERRFNPGGEIFPEGAPGDSVYFVKSGAVEISTAAAGRRVFSRLGPGEIFGEMAVIEQLPRSAAAAAIGATEVYFLPRNELLNFIEGSPGFSIALLQHISARLRNFNQLHLREIVEAERLAAVGQFARGIVHDLKNPLSIIGLTTELMSGPNATHNSREQAQARILRQVQRINDLATDILAFTEGRQKLKRQPEIFAGFFNELMAEVQADLAGRPVRLVLESEPPAVIISFDRRGLNRVLHNLCGNAADAMEKGGDIHLRCQADDGALTVEVEDSGPGIAPEIAGDLFQPFATHGKAKGTGLGLAICKKIIEDHGGKISARSEPGRGAVFTFTLPLPK